MEDDGVHVRPLLHLALPMRQRRERRHHKEGATNALLTVQVVEHRDALGRLAEAHLIRQHDAPPGVPRSHQPVEALELVVAQGTVALVERRLDQRCGAATERRQRPRGRAPRSAPLAELANLRLSVQQVTARLPRARRVPKAEPLDQVHRRQAAAVRRLRQHAFDAEMLGLVPRLAVPAALLSLRLVVVVVTVDVLHRPRIEEALDAALHVGVGLERSSRHPLAVDVRQALPLDVELLRAALTARLEDALHARRREDQASDRPHAGRRRRGRSRAASPRPVVAAVDPKALVVKLAIEDHVHPSDRPERGVDVGVRDDAQLHHHRPARGGAVGRGAVGVVPDGDPAADERVERRAGEVHGWR